MGSRGYPYEVIILLITGDGAQLVSYGKTGTFFADFRQKINNIIATWQEQKSEKIRLE